MLLRVEIARLSNYCCILYLNKTQFPVSVEFRLWNGIPQNGIKNTAWTVYKKHFEVEDLI